MWMLGMEPKEPVLAPATSNLFTQLTSMYGVNFYSIDTQFKVTIVAILNSRETTEGVPVNTVE